MTKRLLCVAALLLLGGIVLHNPVPVLASDAKEFKDGWNTWATTKKGDWAEYSFTAGMTKRYECLGVNGDDVTVKITLTPINALGQPVEPIEQKPVTQHWSKFELVGGRVAKGATWTTRKLRTSAGEIDCDDAGWRFDASTIGLSFSKAVPCGGAVASIINGKETIWLSSWGKAGKEVGRITKAGGAAAPANPVAVKPEVETTASIPSSEIMNRWQTVGNYWVTRTNSIKPAARQSFTRFEVTAFSDGEATYRIVFYDKDMKETSRRDGLKLRTQDDATVRRANASAGGDNEEVQIKGLGRVTATRTELANGGSTTTLWTWRGLVVKSVSQGVNLESETELWETNLKAN